MFLTRCICGGETAQGKQRCPLCQNDYEESAPEVQAAYDELMFRINEDSLMAAEVDVLWDSWEKTRPFREFVEAVAEMSEKWARNEARAGGR